MKISIIIPFKNELDEIDGVISHLLSSSCTNSVDIEIIVVNDGSVYGSGRFCSLELDYPNVKVINNHKSFGVGYAFDRGVENCTSEIIVLMGCDVFPKEGWYDKVIEAVQNNPNTLGNAVCIGDKTPYTKHYGADLLFTVGNDDLPLKSKLRERRGGYTSLFKARWKDRVSNEPYEIPCLLGAFYFTSKTYYNLLGGWDTVRNDINRGFRSWGHLEPFISLKSWLYGGGCTLYPDIEATHIFGRIDIYNQWKKGGRSAEWQWWNCLWALETMILSDFTRNRLYDFVNPELNFGVAQKMIRDNKVTIERVKERNHLEFQNDLSIFETKFGYKI